MALAGGCVTGMLWKAGAGAVALVIAIAGFAAGELLIRGPGERADRDARRREPARRGALTGLLGRRLRAARAGARRGRARRAARRGGATGSSPGSRSVSSPPATWVAADAAGYGYGLGFVGAAEGTRTAIEAGGALPFQLWLAPA